jgi:hypothetical protein
LTKPLDKESLWEITKTNDSYYLTIGGEGATEIHLSSPTFSGGCSHADGSAFRIGEKVYLEQLDEWTDLTGVKIQALDAQGKTLYMCSILSDMGRQTLSLNDVIMLSQKGDALTWSDFDPFRYTENGSGLYIREYPINDMFTLWIGGTDTDSKPMYVYLGLTDKRDVRIDIRYRDVTEFIFRADRNPTFEVTFAGDSSVQQFFSVSEYQPYWSIWVENTGKASIIMEVGGETYRIEPGTSESITPDEKWEPGSYTVSFTSSHLSGMTGHAVCEVFSVLLGTVEIKA